MSTPNVKDIMASINKTPTTKPSPMMETHENTSDKKDGGKTSSDATASPEATPLLDPINNLNKELFLNKVKGILKHKVSDSNDLKNAMKEISSLLYDN